MTIQKANSDPFAALRDRYGMPARSSIERCINFSRAFGYASLFAFTCLKAAIEMIGWTLSCFIVLYAEWTVFWFMCWWNGGRWFDLWETVPFWNVSLQTHAWLLLVVFIVTRFMREQTIVWRRVLAHLEVQFDPLDPPIGA